MSAVLESPPLVIDAVRRISSDAPMTWQPPDDEQWFIMHDIDYATYVRVCDAFGER